MKKMKKITAILLSVLMLISMFGMVASAAEVTAPLTPTTDGKWNITKKLEMDGLVETYPDMTFAFTFTNLTKESNDAELKEVLGAEYAKLLGEGTAPTLKNAEIKINGDTRTTEITEGTTATVTGTADIVKADGSILTAADFGNIPGIYIYKVTENTLTDNWGSSEDISNSKWEDKITVNDKVFTTGETYYIIASVYYNETVGAYKLDLYAKEKTETKDTEGNVTATSYPKVTEVDFVNEYQRSDGDGDGDGGNGNSSDPDDFKITKTVTGQLGDQKKLFDFELTIYKNATEADNVNGYYATITYADTTKAAKTEFVTFGQPYPFQLAHGDVLTFDELPVGTKYVVKEILITDDGYDPTMNVLEGSAPFTTFDKDDATAGTKEVNGENVETKILSSGEQYIHEGDNYVAVTNNKGTTPFTGIVTDNLSFILLIVVAVAGMTAYVVLKRRLRSR